jgi:hypothetical protein
MNWSKDKSMPKECPNQPNPNATQLIEQVKREAADCQADNNKLCMQRKCINKANETLATQEETAPEAEARCCVSAKGL